MGLDNYAAKSPDGGLTDEDLAAFEAADIHLGASADGFRGKLYDELISNVTGVSLYERWITPEVVRQMWVALERCDPEEVTKDINVYKDTNTPSTVEEFRKFFRVCVERNLGLIASW